MRLALRLPRLRGASGFTLLEIMVVLAVIGVLVAMAIPAYNRFTRKAREVEGEIAVRRVETLEKQFRTDFGAYTESLDSLAYPDLPLRKWYGLEVKLGKAGDDFAYQAMSAPNPPMADQLDTWYITKFADQRSELVHCYKKPGKSGKAPKVGKSSQPCVKSAKAPKSAKSACGRRDCTGQQVDPCHPPALIIAVRPAKARRRRPRR